MAQGASFGAEGAETVIEARNVCKTYRRRSRSGTEVVEALAQVSLRAGRHEFVSLLGPSGCGKTTLLKIVGGLVPADGGEVRVNGLPVNEPPPGVGFVFQNVGLLPWRTVLGNVEFGLEPLGLSRQERRERAERLLELVGLKDFASFHPHELSGGMQQRVGLARALAIEPTVLLMDEPFGALDAYTRELMQVELLKIIERHRVAVLFVTHSLDEALLLSDTIVLFTPRPGRVKEVIHVDLPRPRDESIRTTPRFAELRDYLWHSMRADDRVAARSVTRGG